MSILEGDTFVVSDRTGDIDASPDEPHGLFQQDTRFLSRWQLTVDGGSPAVLSTDDVDYFAAQFFLAPPGGTVYVEAKYSLIRTRAVGGGFHEDLTVINHAPEPLELELRVDAAADFADLFEVKDALEKKGEHYSSRRGRAPRARVPARRLRPRNLDHRQRGRRRSWTRAASASGSRSARTASGRPVSTSPPASMPSAATRAARSTGTATRAPGPNMRLSLEEWLGQAPELTSDRRSLELMYERSLVDLAALRFYPPLLPGTALPAAGLPWFMTVFGRDSLITSYQALPYRPRARRGDPPRPRRATGDAPGRLPRRGAGQDPPRVPASAS